MTTIIKIRCPICKERLSGTAPEDLSTVLKSHLADVHEMTRFESQLESTTSTTTTERSELPAWNQGGGSMLTAEEERHRQIAAVGAASSAASASTLERQVETWSPTDPTMLTAEERRQREIVTTFKPPDLAPGSEERAVETWSGNEPAMGSSDRLIQEVEQWKAPRETQTHTEKHAGDWKPHEEGRSEESERLKRSVAEWRDPRTGEAMSGRSMTQVSHGGGTWHRMIRRGEMTMFLACPICGNAVYGSDEDDLSDELRFHFRDEHNIRR